jgi:voltage-gated potassium channel Kch
MVKPHMPSPTPAVVTWKFRPLLYSLLLILLLFPYIEGRVLLLRGLTAVVLLTGIYAVSRDRRIFVFACFLGLPTLGLEAMSILSLHASAEIAARIGTVMFSAFTTGSILWNVLKEQEITTDTLYGAACAYLLSGYTWTTLYVLLEVLHPGSFYVGSAQNLDQVVNFSDLIYFSLVTLTTLGYGDITPLTSPARSLAVLEAVFGVLYSAILIARLVGLYKPTSPSNGAPQD